MFAVAKKIRDLEPPSARPIPARGKVEANTPTWRERVAKELDDRPRGARMDLVRHLRERYPTFSSGHLTELLAPDEKMGQQRYSRYIGEINRYLWPDEYAAEIQPALEVQLRTMTADEQLRLADFIRATREKK